MKKHLHNSLRALFLSLAVLLSLPMLAEEVEIGGINYYLNAEAKQATVIKKSSGEYSGEVVIPESVEHEGNAYSVTSIGEKAFYDCDGLTSVTIPNSVESIGDHAFNSCSYLTSVTIPNSVTSIGDGAFMHCFTLTSVSIGNSVKSIGERAFYLCSNLTSVTIGNSVTSIGGGAFSGCPCLTSIVVEDGNPVYDSRNNCNAIIETSTNTLHSGCQTTVIPNSVTSIGDDAFFGCSGLISVTIPNSVTSIGDGAFSGCSGLTSVTIPNSVTGIGDWAFNNCTGLTSVTIGNSVTSIGDYAFRNCSGLTSVTIPNSVTSIGGEAFSGCSGLTSVTIPNSVTSIEAMAFYSCSGLTSVTIGNSVTSIGDYAFRNCSGLTSVAIPNSVTSIGDYAFSGCSGLTSVTIPNSVKSIWHGTFSNCSGLTSVTIGNSVEDIGSQAFASCPELLDVYCYAENVLSTQSNAFEGSYPENATLHVPNVSVDSYKATEPWSSFSKIVGLSREYSLTVSLVGYATLYLDFNAEIPEDVEAYVAKEVVDSRLKMERVEGVLPANTGVIIMAEEGTYIFVESDKTPAVIEKNLLKGTVEKTEITAEANTSYYVLSAPDGVVAMYLALLTDNKFWNNANKAYLPISYGDLGIFDEEVDSSVEQLSRMFVFDFGDETSITETEIGKVKSENSALFDLSGRRVQKAQKGIFIQNGKVVVK